MSTIEKKLADAEAVIEMQAKLLAVLHEALKFYADEESWDGGGGYGNVALGDYGDIARDAIAKAACIAESPAP